MLAIICNFIYTTICIHCPNSLELKYQSPTNVATQPLKAHDEVRNT